MFLPVSILPAISMESRESGCVVEVTYLTLGKNSRFSFISGDIREKA
jgi:hypothetical protein